MQPEPKHSPDVRSASRPDPWTGWFGTLFSVLLLVPLAYRVLEFGKPKITPLGFGWAQFNTDRVRVGGAFVSVVLVLVLVLLAMAGWERTTGSRRRLLYGWVFATALGHFLTVTSVFGDVLGSAPSEIVLTLGTIGFVVLFILEVSAGRHVDFSAEATGAGRPRVSLEKAFRVALGRYLTGAVVFGGFGLVMFTHPHFGHQQLFGAFRLFFVGFLALYAALGLPYMVLTERLRAGRDDPKRDFFFPSLVLLVTFVKAIPVPGLRRGRLGRVLRLVRKPWVRTSLLDLLVKGFFLPIMLGFVVAELDAMTAAMRLLTSGRSGSLFSGIRDTFLHTVLIIDVVIGTIGYAASSRWLGNKSVSVDPSALGWAAALICYPPFNSAPSTLFPYAAARGNWMPEGAASAISVLMVLLFCVYTWATIVFGLRFSNLTNRGIIDHGPYAWVRHPAYAAKLLAWWAEWIPRFTLAWQPISLFLFSFVYILRAITEERHLLRDPAYRAYAQRVRYRFLPGLF